MSQFVEDLNSLKYAELQKLAKTVGIRANQKVEKLIKALNAHYEESVDEKEVSSNAEYIGNIKEESVCLSPCPSSGAVHLSPSVTRKAKTSSGEIEIFTPNENGRRKRRGTFELAEASLKDNTPTIDGELTEQKRRHSPRFAAESEKDETRTQTPTKTGGRKRRRTFELDEASVQGSTPTIDTWEEKQTGQRNSQDEVSFKAGRSEIHLTKRRRKRSFNRNSPTIPLTSSKSSEKVGSPGTKAIIDAIDANVSSEERKKMLLDAIKKKVQNSVNSNASAKTSQPSHIPRYTTFLVGKKKEAQKPATPGNKDWKKIHNKAFSKFDSIDVYLNKKKQRQDQLSVSAKKTMPSESSAQKRPTLQRQDRPSSSAKKTMPFGSPALKSKPAIVKPVQGVSGKAKIFQPQNTSVRSLDFNFTKMSSVSKTPSKSLITPSKKSDATPTSLRKSSKQTDLTSHTRGTGATPFKFTGNTSMSTSLLGASGKTTFDLKASLARPMTWKPHTGKLQPVDFNKAPPVRAKTQRPKGTMAHRALATKTRTAQVKNVVRTAVVDRRSNQKYVDMMRKRGLIA